MLRFLFILSLSLVSGCSYANKILNLEKKVEKLEQSTNTEKGTNVEKTTVSERSSVEPSENILGAVINEEISSWFVENNYQISSFSDGERFFVNNNPNWTLRDRTEPASKLTVNPGEVAKIRFSVPIEAGTAVFVRVEQGSEIPVDAEIARIGAAKYEGRRGDLTRKDNWWICHSFANDQPGFEFRIRSSVARTFQSSVNVLFRENSFC